MSTTALRNELATSLPDRPFHIELWDGSRVPATNGGGPTFSARTPDAIGHLLRAPGQLGLGRAYVSGALAVDDLDAVMALLDEWHAPPIDGPAKRRLMLAALRAMGVRKPPAVPQSELKPKGRRHSPERDARAVRHHYDLPPEFFRLFLDESMTYSCAIFSRGATTLEEAQETKLELVCTKLDLQKGERLLDVGCGWGSFALHAAKHHGVEVTAITLSPPQAEIARRRVAEAGLQDKVDVQIADYRAFRAEPFDKIASIGMVEHVGVAQIDVYTRCLFDLLKPGGQVLNHGIARLRHTDAEAGPFSERYVFPDAAPLHLSRIQFAMERAGFATNHVEGFAADYAETLTHWIERLDANLDEAERLAGGERVRVWRLYLRAARNGFLTGFTSVYQVRATKPE